jgi:biopolymer transport protein TolR
MRKGSIEKGGESAVSDINITPLADISLTLLIVLMIVTPMAMQSMIQVAASGKAAATEKKEEEKPLFIEIRPDGLFLNTKEMLTEEKLFVHLRSELTLKENKQVMITAGTGVRHGSVVRVLDIAKQAGAEHLALLKKRG